METAAGGLGHMPWSGPGVASERRSSGQRWERRGAARWYRVSCVPLGEPGSGGASHSERAGTECLDVLGVGETHHKDGLSCRVLADHESSHTRLISLKRLSQAAQYCSVQVICSQGPIADRRRGPISGPTVALGCAGNRGFSRFPQVNPLQAEPSNSAGHRAMSTIFVGQYRHLDTINFTGSIPCIICPE